MDNDTRIEQPLLHNAEHILIEDDGEVDAIDEEKREMKNQAADSLDETSNQSSIVQSSLSTSAHMVVHHVTSALSYMASGLLGLLLFLIMSELVLSCVATVVNWFDVVLETHVEGENVYKETTLLTVNLMDFLRFFYNSDCHIFWSIFVTFVALTSPFMRVALQCISLCIIVDILLFARQNSGSISDSFKNWANMRWSIVGFQLFHLAPHFYKYTGTAIYLGAFFIAITSIDLLINDVKISIKLPFGVGGILFYIAQLCSQITNALAMYKLEKMIQDKNHQHQKLEINDNENSDSISEENKTEVGENEVYADEDEFVEFHDPHENAVTEAEEIQVLVVDNHRPVLSDNTRKIASFLAALSLVTGTVVWFLPVMSIEYYGLESNFLEEGDLSKKYTIWDLFWEAYKAIDGDMIAVGILGLFVIETIVLPAIALALSLALLESRSRTGSSKWRNIALILQYIRPFMNLESLIAAVITFGGSIETLAEYLFNDFDICQEIEVKSDTSCLSINCKFLAGTWVLLTYQLALMAFIILILPVPTLAGVKNQVNR